MDFELAEENITKETEQEEQGSEVHTKLPGFYTCFLKSIVEKRGIRANEQFVHGGPKPGTS